MAAFEQISKPWPNLSIVVEYRLCPCLWERHNIQVTDLEDGGMFKGEVYKIVRQLLPAPALPQQRGAG
jgi:hypothetical protein